MAILKPVTLNICPLTDLGGVGVLVDDLRRHPVGRPRERLPHPVAGHVGGETEVWGGNNWKFVQGVSYFQS